MQFGAKQLTSFFQRIFKKFLNSRFLLKSDSIFNNKLQKVVSSLVDNIKQTLWYKWYHTWWLVRALAYCPPSRIAPLAYSPLSRRKNRIAPQGLHAKLYSIKVRNSFLVINQKLAPKHQKCISTPNTEFMYFKLFKIWYFTIEYVLQNRFEQKLFEYATPHY